MWPHPSGVVACDPYFGNVVLLMGYEGVNGSTGAPGMTDESPAAHGVATGLVNATISNTKVEFGSTSLFLNSGRIQYANSNDWNFGAGNFTLELWVNFNSLAGIQRFISTWNGTNDSNLGFTLGMTSAGTRLTWEVSTTGINGFIDINAVWAPVINQWYFITLDYNGTTYRAYVNGTMIGSSTTARTIFNSTHNLNIGSDNDGSSPLLGYMDELRITKGVARYASDSGFAVPTAAFPRVACGSPGFDPASAINASVTNSNKTVTYTGGGTAGAHVYNSEAQSTGKYYFEVTYTVASGYLLGGNIGVAPVGTTIPNFGSLTNSRGATQQGQLGGDGSFPYSFGNRAQGDTIALAVDVTNRLIWFRVVSGTPGLWNGDGTANPATGVNGISLISGSLIPYVVTGTGAGNAFTANFGGSAFTGTVPSGFTSGWP